MVESLTECALHLTKDGDKVNILNEKTTTTGFSHLTFATSSLKHGLISVDVDSSFLCSYLSYLSLSINA